MAVLSSRDQTPEHLAGKPLDPTDSQCPNHHFPAPALEVTITRHCLKVEAEFSRRSGVLSTQVPQTDPPMHRKRAGLRNAP